MTDALKQMIEKAATIRMSPADQEAQRRSFAYGNAHIENDKVTREMIDAAADHLSKK